MLGEREGGGCPLPGYSNLDLFTFQHSYSSKKLRERNKGNKNSAVAGHHNLGRQGQIGQGRSQIFSWGGVGARVRPEREGAGALVDI